MIRMMNTHQAGDIAAMEAAIMKGNFEYVSTQPKAPEQIQ